MFKTVFARLANWVLDHIYYPTRSGERFWEFVEITDEIRWPGVVRLRGSDWLVLALTGLSGGVSMLLPLLNFANKLTSREVWPVFFAGAFCASLIGASYITRRFYKGKYGIRNQPKIALAMHRFSEAMRQFDHGGKHARRTSLSEALTRFVEMARAMFDADTEAELEVVFNVKRDDFLYRLTEDNSVLQQPKKIKKRLSKDFCFRFFSFVARLKEAANEKRTVILTNTQGLSVPGEFTDAYEQQGTPADSERNALNKLCEDVRPEKRAAHIYEAMQGRMQTLTYKSLIRMNVTDSKGDGKKVVGVVFLASRKNFTFYRCPEAYIDFLLACVDQMYPILAQYQRDLGEPAAETVSM